MIEDRKIRDYLLSDTHPSGRFKSYLFGKLGFTSDNWPHFKQAIKRIAIENEAEPAGASRFGRKFIVRGKLAGQSGRSTALVTVWILRSGEKELRFVTAYPEG